MEGIITLSASNETINHSFSVFVTNCQVFPINPRLHKIRFKVFLGDQHVQEIHNTSCVIFAAGLRRKVGTKPEPMGTPLNRMETSSRCGCDYNNHSTHEQITSLFAEPAFIEASIVRSGWIVFIVLCQTLYFYLLGLYDY